MTGRHVRGPDDDDAPTLPVMSPLPPDPLGIPGLDYMPRPDDGPLPPTAPAPDRDPRRSWLWLAGLAAFAVLAAFGVVWVVGGGAADAPPQDRPAAATDPEVPPLPEDTIAPLPTEPDFTTAPPPPPTPSLSVTVSPTPSDTTAAPTPQPMVRVPDVVGQRRPAAESTMQRAGFAVSVRLVPAQSPRDDRRVLGQQPPAGQTARPGSVVVLVVGERTEDESDHAASR